MEIPVLNTIPNAPTMTRTSAVTGSTANDQNYLLKKAATDFETAFLSEMLKHTGVGQLPETFNGGPGEEAFSDFLIREYAAKISETGAIGIADQVYAALVEKSNS